MKVVVLGAGVVGVASAWYLAEAGHDVTVVERQSDAGRETSFANGGQISAGHAEPWARPDVLPKMIKWLGREDAPMLFRPRASLAQWEWGLRFLFECLPGRFARNTRELAGLALYSRDCLATLRERTGIEYQSSRRGILHFCTDEQEFAALARHAESMRRLGVEREVKSRAECIALEPALASSTVDIVGGVHTPQDESGDAFEFTQGLARLAQARGVSFRYGTTVQAIETAADRVIGVTARSVGVERIEGDAYVVALGSYSPLLCARLGVRMLVYPLKGYSITIPLTPEQAAVAPNVSLTDEACKIVISRLGDRLRSAGTAELGGYDTEVNPVRCEAILERVRQLFPRLAPFGEITPWAGLRPATPNNVPLIGGTRLRNLYLNTGHGTLGWTLACGSGRALADLVSGRHPEVGFNFQ
ncbi:MAG: D-amino acid dehydrogenase [Burkholderiales bacterium]